MDTRVFLMIFYHGSLLWPWRGKYTHTNWYPPFVLLCGEKGWAIALLLFLGCPGCYFNSLPPSVTPGCCEPSPLLSSVAGAPGGEAGLAQRNPAVRVLGQGSCSSLSQAMKHKRLSGSRGQSRGTHHPETVCTVFFFQGLIKWPEIKTEKGLNSRSVWTVCIQRHKAFKN